MQKIEATYYCKLHGLFTMMFLTGAPPKHLTCPTCLGPSTLSSFSVTGPMPADHPEITVETIRKIRDAMMGISSRPWAPAPAQLSSGAGVGGDSQDIDVIDVSHIPVEVEESVLTLHEAKERGKMEAMIAALES